MTYERKTHNSINVLNDFYKITHKHKYDEFHWDQMILLNGIKRISKTTVQTTTTQTGWYKIDEKRVKIMQNLKIFRVSRMLIFTWKKWDFLFFLKKREVKYTIIKLKLIQIPWNGITSLIWLSLTSIG